MECMICLESPGEEKFLRLCDGKHGACYDCFQEWAKQALGENNLFMKDILCPCCRMPVFTKKSYEEHFEEIFWSGFTGSVSYEHPMYALHPSVYPKWAEVSFRDGKRDGVYREYSPDYSCSPDGIVCEKHYSNGVLHGLSTIYNRGYSMAYTYVDGVRNGPARHTNPEGLVTFEGNMVDGETHGLFIMRQQGGDYMEIPYDHGKYHGRWLYWKKNVENGQMFLYKEVLYEQGERHGPTKVFNPEGELVSEIEYIHGKVPLLQENGTTTMITRDEYTRLYPERRLWA